MIKYFFSLFVFFAFCIPQIKAAGTSSYDKVYVTTTSDDEYTDSTSNDCSDDITGSSCSLRQALQVVEDGGEVIISAGKYCIEKGSLDVYKNLTITGLHGADDTFIGGKNSTYLTECAAAADFSIFTFYGIHSPGMKVSMQGLSVVNGNEGSSFTSGITSYTTSVLLEDVKMYGHSGSALFFDARDAEEITLVVKNSTFSHNESVGPGGGVSLKFYDNIQVDILFDTVSILENTSQSAGGGMFVATYGNSSQVSIVIENSDLMNNQADTSGGGLYYSGSDQNDTSEDTSNIIQWEINNTLISGNKVNTDPTGGAGGGFQFSYDSWYAHSANEVSLNINNSIIENNHVEEEEDKGVGVGGGISLHYSQVAASTSNQYTTKISDSIFSENEAQLGGGISIDNFTSSNVITEVSGSFFKENIAHFCGGGIDYYLDGISSDLTINRSTFLNNESQIDGGAVCMENVTESGRLALTLAHSTLSENTARYNGGALYLYNLDSGPNQVIVLNSTIAYNISSIGEGGGLYLEPSTSATLSSTILYGNESSDRTLSNCYTDASGTFSSNYSYIPEGTCLGYLVAGEGDLVTGDLLLGELTSFGKIQVYPLEEGSAAIDVGSCDGLDELVDGRNAVRAEPCDIGAYEFGASYCGNGTLGDTDEEQCDDGNNQNGDGCSSDCIDEDDGDGDTYSEAQGDCDDENGSIHPTASDLCDGVDNDCDGLTDEDFVSEVTACGVGVCTGSGSTSCTEGGLSDSCIPLEAGIEICENGLDDDCDGSADEPEDCTVTGSSTSSDSTTGDPTTTGEGSGDSSSTGEETTGGDSSSTGEGSGGAENGTTDGTTGVSATSSTTGEEGSSSSSTSSDGSDSSGGSDTSDGGASDEGNPNPTPPPADGNEAEGSSGCSLKV